jgi:hypothetical protein
MNLEIDSSFALLLDKYINSRRINMNKLAKAIGVTLPAIKCWRDGKVLKPDCSKVERCAEVFKLCGTEREKFLAAAGCFVLPLNTKTKKPSNISIAPIPTSRPIIYPIQFFGRKVILKKIFSNWQNSPLEHIAITGPKRSGKTSLLHYLKSIHSHTAKTLRENQRYKWFKQKYNWVFVDFDAIHCPANFLHYVLKELNFGYENTEDVFDLTERLRHNIKKPTVILMDNIKSGLQSSELDEEFWRYIRYLGNNIEQLGFCIAANDSLADLEDYAAKLGKSSPTENIFSAIELGPFTKEEAYELLCHTQLVQTDIEWIIEKSCGWPVLLQMLCKIKLDGEYHWKEIGLRNIQRYEYLLSEKYCGKKTAN